MEERLKTESDIKLKLAGEKLSQTYVFAGEIASGGMGVVYKAHHITLNKDVAIKILHQVSPQTVVRFQREAQAACALHHENVVAVHEFGVTESGQPFMVMDYVSGRPLSALIAERSALNVEFCLDVFKQICAGIRHAHAKGVLHRDLKPSNIMCTEVKNGKTHVQIVDFGIAKILTGEQSDSGKLTQTGDILGSPLYMSPEQCFGKQIDFRSDIYSIGCIMFECLTGTPPLAGSTVMDTMLKQMNDPAPPLSQNSAGKNFPRWLERLVARALEKDPDLRFQNLDELCDALDKRVFADVKPAKVSPNRAIPRAVVISCLVLAAVAGTITVFALKEKKPDQQKVMISNTIPEKVPSEADPAYIEKFDSLASDPDTFAREMIAEPETRTIALCDRQVTDAALTGLLDRKNVTTLNFCRTKVTAAGLRNVLHLQTLDDLLLRGNPQITDEALKILTKAKSVQVLDVAETGISDQGLQYVPQIARLRELNLSRDNVSDSGLLNLRNMDRLEQLILDGDSKVTDKGIAYLATCENLSELDLRGTGFSKAGVSELSSLHKLAKLSMDARDIDDSCIDSFDALPLTYLCINRSSLTNSGIAKLKKIETLTALDLGWTPQIGGKALAIVAQLPSLSELAISRTSITNHDLASLGACKNLQKLDVSGDMISGPGLELIAKFHLTDLNIANTQIRATDLKLLYETKSLTTLTVNPRQISKEDAIELKKYLPDCRVMPYDRY